MRSPRPRTCRASASAPGSSMPAAIRRSSTASSTRRSIAARRCSIRAPTTSCTAGRATPTAPRARRRRKHSRAPGRPSPAPPGRCLRPPGLAAVTLALMSCLKAGDHLLVTDSVYRPTRQFCDGVLKALRRRDDLLRPGARRRHRGAAAAEHHGGVHRGAGLAVLRDAGHPGHRRGGAPRTAPSCSWTTPGRRRCCSRRTSAASISRSRPEPNTCRATRTCCSASSRRTHAPGRRCGAPSTVFAMCAGPEDVFLALRGLRTMALRLKEHERQALDMARWLEARPEVAARAPPGARERSRPRDLEARLQGLVGAVLDRARAGAEGGPRGDARRPRAVRDRRLLGRLREPRDPVRLRRLPHRHALGSRRARRSASISASKTSTISRPISMPGSRGCGARRQKRREAVGRQSSSGR